MKHLLNVGWQPPAGYGAGCAIIRTVLARQVVPKQIRTKKL